MDAILQFTGNAIYVAMALVALYGVFLVILLIRRIAQKRFSSRSAEEQFLEDIRGELEQRNFEGAAEVCDSPAFWSKAVPQLIVVALENRERAPVKLRRLLAEQFERDVLADLEYRLSWIGTIVKSAPMLGLLGTVVGMINAFAKIAAASQTGTDPSVLANDISFALFTTALGLTIAIPLVLAGALISVRLGKLQDAVQHSLGEFLDSLEAAMTGRGGQ